MASVAEVCCCICGEAAGSDAASGLTCSEKHYVCADCLNGLVPAELSAENIRQRRSVRCPHRGALGGGGRVDVCPATFTVVQLQGVLRPEVFAKVLGDALSALDAVGDELKRKSDELEKAGGAAAARMAEAEKASAGQARADCLNSLRQALIEAHIVLRCPRCHAAFVDYMGCDAVTCGRPGCGCGFCALCLKDCGSDAHAHLSSQHGGYFRGMAAFKQAHSERQRKGVQAAIAALREPADFKADLAKSLEGDFADAAPAAAGPRGGAAVGLVAGVAAAAAAGVAAVAAALLGRAGGGGGGMDEWAPGWGLGPAEKAALPPPAPPPMHGAAGRRQARQHWRDPQVALAMAGLDALEARRGGQLEVARGAAARRAAARVAATAAAAARADALLAREEDAALRAVLEASLAGARGREAPRPAGDQGRRAAARAAAAPAIIDLSDDDEAEAAPLIAAVPKRPRLGLDGGVRRRPAAGLAPRVALPAAVEVDDCEGVFGPGAAEAPAAAAAPAPAAGGRRPGRGGAVMGWGGGVGHAGGEAAVVDLTGGASAAALPRAKGRGPAATALLAAAGHSDAAAKAAPGGADIVDLT